MAAVAAEPTGEAVQLGTAVLVGRYADGSPEWHEARSRVIGGSEVGSIMQVNSFESRYVLWYRKAGYLHRDENGPVNPLYEWGHRLEPVVAEKFADNHPEYDVQVSGSWIHKDRPWHGANPDRLLAPVYSWEQDGVLIEHTGEPEAILEIKTSMSGYGWENDMCPVKYVAQLRWYMECFGLDYGYLAVLVSLGDYREFLVPRDPSKPVVSMQTGNEEWYSIGGTEMLDAAAKFYYSLPGMCTPAGTPPDIDGGTDTYELLRERHPDISNVDVEVKQELADMLKAALAAQEEAIAEAQRMKNVVLEIMGKGRRAIIPTADPKKPVIVARRQSKKGGKPYLVTV